MIRALLLATVVASLIVVGATYVGHAIDVELQQRVTYTRDGNIFDCQRVVEDHGRVFYRDCHQIP